MRWPAVAVLLLIPYCASSHVNRVRAEIVNDRVIIPVRVNGQGAVPFLLDTGASESVLNSDRLAELGLSARGSGKASVEGGEVDSSSVADVSFNIGGVLVRKPAAATLSLRGVESGLGHKLYGIIGSELFRRTVVTIDYAHREVILGDTARHGKPIPITIDEETPIVDARLGAVTGKMQLDTGGGIVTLNASFLAQHPEIVPATTLEVTSGAVLPGRSRGGVGRLDAIDLGPFRLSKPIVNFSHNTSGDRVARDAGFIGGDVLRRFTVTFDYAHQRVFLQPDKALEEPFEFSMAGVSFVSDEGRVVVRSVIPGGPADQAGLKAGDVVQNVELEALRKSLSVPDREVALRVEPNRTVRIKTRRLL
jgi:hypothetical protein